MGGEVDTYSRQEVKSQIRRRDKTCTKRDTKSFNPQVVMKYETQTEPKDETEKNYEAHRQRPDRGPTIPQETGWNFNIALDSSCCILDIVSKRQHNKWSS